MIKITTAAHALAQMRARQAVKDQLKRQGLKPTHYSAKEISALAREYLLQHRDDLMPEAAASIIDAANPSLRLMLLFAASTGVRAGEQ